MIVAPKRSAAAYALDITASQGFNDFMRLIPFPAGGFSGSALQPASLVDGARPNASEEIPALPQLNLSRVFRSAAKIKSILPIVALLLLAGCTTPPAQVSASSVRPTATIKGSSSNPVDFFLGNDAECRIQAIDGVKVGPNDRLLPGNHILTVTLHSVGRDYPAKVNLIIPGAKSYQLKAKRKDDAFTLWLLDEEASKTVATSTAPIKERMEFLVFVVQK